MIERKTHGIDLEKQIMTLMMPNIYLQLGGGGGGGTYFHQTFIWKGVPICVWEGVGSQVLFKSLPILILSPPTHTSPGKIKPK